MLNKQAKKQQQTLQKISFIGSGNMARAIIGGLVEAGWEPANILATNPSEGKLRQLEADFEIKTTQDNQQAVNFAEVVVLSVKPQKISLVCQQLASLDWQNKLLISIAAGYPTEQIEQNLRQQTAIIRAMPNTPALIGCGATGLFATAQVSQQQKQIGEQIFQSVGQTSWIDEESQMNIVTAIAGSSPAYLFLFMQAMLEQAVACGLSEKSAFELITQSMAGAALLANNQREKGLTQLRQEVTSPGGTTEAAIGSFQVNHFEEIVKQAVNAAIERGSELGKAS